MSIREHPEVKMFRDAAERYCALMQSDPEVLERWVEEVLAALSSLYAAAHALPDLGLCDDAPLPKETVGRFGFVPFREGLGQCSARVRGQSCGDAEQAFGAALVAQWRRAKFVLGPLGRGQ